MREAIINNLKGIKRKLKSIPDDFRRVYGYVDYASRRNRPKLDLHIEYPVDTCGGESEKGMPEVVTSRKFNFMTTFFDIDPASPDGRYLCCTLVPFIHRVPIPGDVAYICIVDLERRVWKAIAKTKGWGAQLGANVQWVGNGKLIYNDVVNENPVGMKYDLETRKISALGGPIYSQSPNGKHSYSADLYLINRLIPGYGVPDPLFGKKKMSKEDVESEGVWRTNIVTGECELFISIGDIIRQLPNQTPFLKGISHIFNVKVSPTGDKLFSVVFAKNIPGRIGWALELVLIDIETKKSELLITDEQWRRGGHHPNWLADGSGILMNLNTGNGLRFVQIDIVTKEIKVLSEKVKGGGHPSLSFDGKSILTDAYVSEGYKDKFGKVPIRLVDWEGNREVELCRVFTNNLDGPRRIDPHPVWSTGGQRVFLNAMVSGKRQVLMLEPEAR